MLRLSLIKLPIAWSNQLLKRVHSLTRLLFFSAVLLILGLLGGAGFYATVTADLPNVEQLRDIQLQIPLRIYDADKQLMAEFGEKRCIPIAIENIPPQLIQAVIAAEDEHFFSHQGIDWSGLGRAVVNLLRTGAKRQGGSTITMQVARNFFLSPEKSYLRKLREMILALRIEQKLTKQEILHLYLNKIYFGNRAYGVGAAAQVYYGVPLEQLHLAQLATLAGLPKAPSRYNPLANAPRSLARRNWILGRMLELGFIKQKNYQLALAEIETASLHGPQVTGGAPFAVEMARAELIAQYGDEAYTRGFHIYLTVKPFYQDAAEIALREGLIEYEERHGYNGPEDTLLPQTGADVLAQYPTVGGLEAVRVIAVERRAVRVQRAGGDVFTLPWTALAWAKTPWSRRAPQRASDIVKVGDVVRVRLTEEGTWRLAQVPQVTGALVSLDPRNGAILALVGGFDFAQSQFNRATQAQRQPGSSFKPFIYSAALESGYSLASVIDDSPLEITLAGEKNPWRPENYGGRYYGPTRLREALVHSRNLVSIRVLQDIGLDYAIDYVQRFGFAKDRLPKSLTLALGTPLFTPLEMATGYAVFANGGYQINPYLIQRVTLDDGALVFDANPLTVCSNCSAPRVVEARNIYLMNSLLQDVIRRGTAARANRLGRRDLAGKTGTTNDERDGWFSGFNPTLLATVWVGYDRMESLGAGETAGKVALPIWMRYMAAALEGIPEQPLEKPAGLVTVTVDSRTGLLPTEESDTISELFRQEEVPTERTPPQEDTQEETEDGGETEPVDPVPESAIRWRANPGL